MKSSFWIAAILLAYCAGAPAAECPQWYPSGFPCIPGAEEYVPPSWIPPPNAPADYKPKGLSYRRDPGDLFGSLVSAATADNWDLLHLEQRALVGLVVYRGVFAKSEARVFVCVFRGPQGAIMVAVRPVSVGASPQDGPHHLPVQRENQEPTGQSVR